MTMKLEQAARALLAHWDTPAWKYLKPTGDLIADLREALAEQAKQEPVAIDWEPLQNFWRNNSGIDWEEFESVVKCAVAVPVRTKDLTDGEIDDVRNKTWCLNNSLREFARAVIAADREKNK